LRVFENRMLRKMFRLKREEVVGGWRRLRNEELGIFLFTTASRTALGSTQPPIQRLPGAFSLGVKQPGREADHSPPSSAEIKNEWSYTSTPNTSSWYGA
jgi:hypothetical protein